MSSGPEWKWKNKIIRSLRDLGTDSPVFRTPRINKVFSLNSSYLEVKGRLSGAFPTEAEISIIKTASKTASETKDSLNKERVRKKNRGAAWRSIPAVALELRER